MLYQSGHYQYAQGPIRPPSEQGSLFVLVQQNCAFSCSFCGLYRKGRYTPRSPADIGADIQAMEAIYHDIKAESFSLGLGGTVTHEVMEAIGRPWVGPFMLRKNGVVDGEVIQAMFDPGFFGDERLRSYLYVADWIGADARNVFLQDADALTVPTRTLIPVLTQLQGTFPWIERVTTYGTGTSTSRKTVDELQELYGLGLRRVHVGLESGSPQLLQLVHKDTDVEHLRQGGLNVKAAGLSLCYYVILGLSGRTFGGHDLVEEHAVETARVINEVNPEVVRFRTLALRQGIPLYRQQQKGTFVSMNDDEIVRQERLLIEHLDSRFTGEIVSDHTTNLLMEVHGKMPDDKTRIMSTIDGYLSLPAEQRAAFQYGRRRGFYRTLRDLEKPAPGNEGVLGKATQLLRSGKLEKTLRQEMARMV
ncbi:radical SAM protein [Candidatus Woesearchaeota archaeon]|nr:radical SAM protein [Candidatus Woesearchaeota archaeon]